MPYKDPGVRRKYHSEYSKKWDAANPEKRDEYKRRYAFAAGRRCKFCGKPHPDRRFKCKHCKLPARGRRKSRALAPVGYCLICTHVARLCQDHNHVSNQQRGLICDNCNRGLGMFKESVSSLRNAANYLENYAAQA